MLFTAKNAIDLELQESSVLTCKSHAQDLVTYLSTYPFGIDACVARL